MKHFLTILVCIFSLSPAMAKRWVNIEVTQVAPANNYSYVEGGNFPVSLIIKNLGPDTLLTTDSLAIRFIDGTYQVLMIQNGTAYAQWMGVKAKKLVPGDTMHVDTTIATSAIPQHNFLSGDICIDAYPCADSIGGLWNTNMDTLQKDNHNPVSGNLNIEVGDMRDAKVIIRNAQGAITGTATEQHKHHFTFNTSGIAPGLYFIEVQGDKDKKITKFTKQ